MNLHFTSGDCNGIGLECFAKALPIANNFLQQNSISCSLAIHPQTLQEYCMQLSIPFTLSDSVLHLGDVKIEIVTCSEYSPVMFGAETREAGALAKQSLERSVDSVLNKQFDALVTLPVSKHALYLAGWQFPGQTEMINRRCGSSNPLMILCNETIRVALVTIHLPLSQVANNISQMAITAKVEQFQQSLISDFGIKNPRIALLGLNPHAGELGTIGTEEETIIRPAIVELQQNGIDAYGPFPADGFFAFGEYKQYDGILAMYHDQGLIPLKLLANGGGVNVTGNVSVIRTSPDHGTGFGIAGKGIADPKSTVEAIKTAFQIYKNRQQAHSL